MQFFKFIQKEFLIKKGYIYVASNIREDCGSGHLGEIDFVKESQLKLYEENDPDVMSFYYDAKKELDEKIKTRSQSK